METELNSQFINTRRQPSMVVVELG